MQLNYHMTETSVTLGKRLNELAAIRASSLGENTLFDKQTDRWPDHGLDLFNNPSVLQPVVRIFPALGLHTLTTFPEDQG